MHPWIAHVPVSSARSGFAVVTRASWPGGHDSGTCVEAVASAAGEDVTGCGQYLTWLGGFQSGTARSRGEGIGQSEELEHVSMWSVTFRRRRAEVAAAYP